MYACVYKVVKEVMCLRLKNSGGGVMCMCLESSGGGHVYVFRKQ